MNFLQKIWSFVSSPFTHPSTALQSDIDAIGKLVDEGEALFDKFGGYAGVLPEPYKSFVAAFGMAVHNLDNYVDTIETKPATTPPTVTPTQSVAPNAPLK